LVVRTPDGTERTFAAGDVTTAHSID